MKRGLPFVRYHVAAHFFLALMVLLITLVGLGLVLNEIHRRHQDNLASHFAAETSRISANIHWRMKAYAQLVRGAGGVFVVDSQVSREDWRNYVASLDLTHLYRGIQGLGFAIYLPPEKRVAHVQSVRREGFPLYDIAPPGTRAAYSSIVYLEPFSGRNRRAFGFDMLSEPVRRAAMEQARDNDAVVFSGRVILVQEDKNTPQAGILAYSPVYAPGERPQTVAQRREALIGWTYSPFRMNDLIDGMLKGDLDHIRLEIFDGDRVEAGALLYDSAAQLPAAVEAPAYSTLVRIDLQGRQWTLRYSSLPSFQTSTKFESPWVEVGAVVVIGLLLMGITWSLISTRRRAELIARQLTRSLRRSESESREMSRSLTEVIWATKIGTWKWNIETGATEFNERWAEIVGYTLEELAPISIDTWSQLVHPEDLQRSGDALERCFRRETELYELEVRMKHKDGHWVWVWDRGRVVEWSPEGKPLRMSGTHQDITEHKQAEQRLQLAASVFTHAREGIIITDSDGHIVDVNHTFSRITGYEHDEVLGQNPRILKSGRHPPEFYVAMWQTLLDTGEWKGEVWNRHKSGEIYVELLNISVVRDERGNIRNFVALFTDITSIKEHQEELERYAHYDALTGLPNRILLADRLQQAMAQAARRGHELAVLYLDLDGFKAVNDQYGHNVGDDLLILVAQRMKAVLRESDTLARVGGDEFVVLLADLESRPDYEQVLERLLQAAADPVILGTLVLNVSASIGVTFFPRNAQDSLQLLEQADQAMYEAKRAGKRCYHLYRPG